MDIKLNPDFGDYSKDATGKNVKDTLDERKDWVENRQHAWNYKKYAYFFLESMSPETVATNIHSSGTTTTPSQDNESIFAFINENNFTGANAIGYSFSGGYLTAFHQDTSDIRTLKPSLTSATISVLGGDNLFDAFIREVDVKFKVYTFDDLNLVERSFFLPGAKATVKYGWADQPDVNLSKELEIRIHDFGFTMNDDGSYDCYIKGLTLGFFIGQQQVSDTIPLHIKEQNALGDGAANPASLPQAFKAAAICAHHNSSWYAWFNTWTAGHMKKFPGLPGASYSSLTFYAACLHPELSMASLLNYFEPMYYYISLEDLIEFIQINQGSAQFSFDSKLCKIKPGHGKAELYGSADPRKYIFPGRMAYYGRSTGFTGTHSNFADAPMLGAQPLKIQNILISHSAINTFYKQVFEQKEKGYVKKTTAKTVNFLRALGNDIDRLSGGLVDIEIQKSKDKDDQFVIFNKTSLQEKANIHSAYVYPFEILKQESIIKNVTFSSDINIDDMLAMTVGRVKSGDVSIEPIKTVYTNAPPIKVKPKTKSKLNDLYGIGTPGPDLIAKWGIFNTGIDDAKAIGIADTMRKLLVGPDGTNGTNITQKVLPYNLKLGITIDGVENIGFAEPVTIDKLPANYKNAGAKFIVDGLEHTFDGDGGWETRILTSMVIGDL
jgi:hypothetical protein